MVSAQDEKILWILDFVCQQQADCFQRLLAPVDVVAQEQVVRLRGKPSVFKKSKQVVILPVDVTAYLNTLVYIYTPRSVWQTTYLDWRLELQQNRLLDEYLACLGAQIPDFVL